MEQDNLITGSLARLFRIGETAGRMGFSLLQRRALEILQHPGASTAGLDQVLKAVDNLSRLKGAPMKIGQMLSLHEDLLPPEITSIFKLLQSEAKPLPFPQMRAILEEDLGSRLDMLERIDETPFASASIGQVHAARHRDGRDIVLKIQYPDIRPAMESDLKSLRMVFSTLFQFLDIPFDHVWQELVARFREELNYVEELRHLQAYRAQLKIDGLHIPEPLPELSSLRVLAMVREDGLSLDRALAHADSQGSDAGAALRDRWSGILLSLVLGGLFHLRYLHADPNAANFGFRENGDVVLYDLGCMKSIPVRISDAYRETARRVVSREYEAIPQILFGAGIGHKDDRPLALDFLLPHLRIIEEVFPDEVAAFGADPTLYTRLMDLGRESWSESKNIVFPGDIIFIHRTLIGHFGNLRRLGARRNWRQTFARLLEG